MTQGAPRRPGTPLSSEGGSSAPGGNPGALPFPDPGRTGEADVRGAAPEVPRRWGRLLGRGRLREWACGTQPIPGHARSMHGDFATVAAGLPGPGVGTAVRMSDNVNHADNSDLRHDTDANPAVQAVEDRVLSWQAGAPVETVREELRKGLDDVGETVPDSWLEQTAERISNADPVQRS